MPRKPRVVIPGLPYHVTQRGTDRQPVFVRPGDHSIYLNLAEKHLEDSGTRVLAYCLMPNHVHWIVIPEFEDSLAILFRRLHGRYAQFFNLRAGRSGHLWQARFYSCPLSRSHLISALQYVEHNPVRAQLCTDPTHYPHSSAISHAEGPNASKLLDWNFWEDFGGAKAWRQLIGSPIDPNDEKHLRRCTHSGAPFGDPTFQHHVEEQSGRIWRDRGRPRLARHAFHL